jgi:hypothetical protein
VESLVGLIVLEGSCFCDHSSQGVAASSHAAARAEVTARLAQDEKPALRSG